MEWRIRTTGAERMKAGMTIHVRGVWRALTREVVSDDGRSLQDHVRETVAGVFRSGVSRRAGGVTTWYPPHAITRVVVAEPEVRE